MCKSNSLKILWDFILGDISNDKFEIWVYGNSDILGEILTNEISLSLVSVNYKNEDSIIKLKQTLEEYLDENFKQKCECLKWRKYQHFNLGWDRPYEFFDDKLMSIKERNNWMRLVECKYCKTNYCLAIDTVEDDFYLIRLNESEVKDIIERDLWPEIFEGYSNLFDNEELKYDHNKKMEILRLFKVL